MQLKLCRCMGSMLSNRMKFNFVKFLFAFVITTFLMKCLNIINNWEARLSDVGYNFVSGMEHWKYPIRAWTYERRAIFHDTIISTLGKSGSLRTGLKALHFRKNTLGFVWMFLVHLAQKDCILSLLRKSFSPTSLCIFAYFSPIDLYTFVAGWVLICFYLLFVGESDFCKLLAPLSVNWIFETLPNRKIQW